MSNKIQFRRGTTSPPTLDAGEPAFRTDTNTLYVGNGTASVPINAPDGWESANSFLYASSSTITVASGALSIYSIGDKIKLTQARSQAYTNDPAAGSNIELNMTDTSGFNVGNKVLVSSSAGQEIATITVVHVNTHITVDTLALNHTTVSPMVYIGTTTVGTKYFYISAVADTVITITGGADYTLENAAISSPYYSHAGSPIGFPGGFGYFPTGISATNVSLIGRFSVIGRMCFCYIIATFTGAITFTTMPTLPIIASSKIRSMTGTRSAGIGDYLDSGTVYVPHGIIPGMQYSGTTVTLVTLTGATLNASTPITWANNDIFEVTFSYEIGD